MTVPPPRVTVGILSYNQARFLPECLRSVAAQTLKDFEVLLADDGSTDGSLDVAERTARELGLRLRLLPSDRNLGITANLNRLLPECRGRYVVLLGADDLLHPGKLESQADFLDRHPASSLCYHDVDFVDERGVKLGLRWSDLHRPRRGLPRLLVRHGCFMPAVGVMMRGENLPREGLPAAIAWAADWLLYIEAARGGTIGYLAQTLGAYRRHPANVTASGKTALDPFLTLAYLEATGKARLGDIRAGRARLYFNQAYGALQAGRRSEGRGLARAALRLRIAWNPKDFLWLVMAAMGLDAPLARRSVRAGRGGRRRLRRD